MKKQNTHDKILKFAQNQTDMPLISLDDLSYIEISGQNHIELDGIRKILEYKDDVIKIRFKHNTVVFKGEKISLANYSQKTAVIEGKIKLIEFE